MLWTIVLILLILWALGGFVLNVGGGGIMTEIVSNSPTLATLIQLLGVPKTEAVCGAKK